MSASMPAAITVAGFNGTLACFTSDRGIAIPPTTIRLGAGAEHSLSLQVTVKPRSVASRRDISRSGLPLSTHA